MAHGIFLPKQKEKWSAFLFLLMIVYVSLRIYRNSFNFDSEQQGGVWNYLSLVYVLCGFYYIMRGRAQNRIFAPFLCYTFIVLLHEVLHVSSLSLANLYYFATAPFFVFVVIVFYCSNARRSKLLIRIIRYCFILIFGLIIYSLLGRRTGRIDDSLLSDVYYLLCYLPIFLLYEEKPVYKIVAILCTGAAIILSDKRAALIGYLVLLGCQFLFFSSHLRRKSRIRNFMVFVLVAVLLYLVYSYFDDTVGIRILFRMSMLQSTGGAGRAQLYSRIVQAFFEMVFGHGRGTILQIPGVSFAAAHSDFLHILYIYGIAPFFVFIGIYVRLFREWVKMKKFSYPYSNLFIGALGVFLILSLFSTFCVAFGYVICGSAFWGLSLADWRAYREGGKIVEINNRNNA